MTVMRLVPDQAAAALGIRKLSPSGLVRLTVYGSSLSLSPIKRFRAADTVGSRNFFAEKRPEGSMLLPAGAGEGHDLYGFDAVLPKGSVTMAMSIRISEDELASLSCDTVLFAFNPVFPDGEATGKAISVSDYLAAFPDTLGFRVLYDVFLNSAAGHTEGRFINYRRANLEILDFTFYSGEP